MAKVTDVDYEVVEKEVDRYECDQCKDVVTEDEINTEAIFDAPDSRSLTAAKDSRHMCDDCVEAERYGTLVKMHDMKESFASMVSRGINLVWDVFWPTVGVIAGISLSLGYTLIVSSPRVTDTTVMSLGDWLMSLLMSGLLFSLVVIPLLAATAYVFDRFTPFRVE